MGYTKHHTIIVSSWNKETITKVHKRAKKIFKENFGDIGLEAVSKLLLSPLNEFYTFIVAPDGSQEGWEESDKGDEARLKLFNYARTIKGSERLSYVELAYGGDDDMTDVLNTF